MVATLRGGVARAVVAGLGVLASRSTQGQQCGKGSEKGRIPMRDATRVRLREQSAERPPCVLWQAWRYEPSKTMSAAQRRGARVSTNTMFASLLFSPRGETKCVRGPSVRGARRLTSAGVLSQSVEHGEQAQRSTGGPLMCLARQPVRNAG